MTFPKEGCYVCKNPIDVIKLGYVSAHSFARDLERMAEDKSLDELTKGENSMFVNAISMEYFLQFPEIFAEDEDDFKDFWEKRAANMKGHNARLKGVIDAVKGSEDPDFNPAVMGEYLFILAHYECAPEQGYHIGLERLDTHEKGIEWTLHLGEKTWFNYYGWNKILNSLYGRISV